MFYTTVFIFLLNTYFEHVPNFLILITSHNYKDLGKNENLQYTIFILIVKNTVKK